MQGNKNAPLLVVDAVGFHQESLDVPKIAGGRRVAPPQEVVAVGGQNYSLFAANFQPVPLDNHAQQFVPLLFAEVYDVKHFEADNLPNWVPSLWQVARQLFSTTTDFQADQCVAPRRCKSALHGDGVVAATVFHSQKGGIRLTKRLHLPV